MAQLLGRINVKLLASFLIDLLFERDYPLSKRAPQFRQALLVNPHTINFHLGQHLGKG